VRYLIEHRTTLGFPTPVREHHCELRLAPHDGEALRVRTCEIEVSPAAELREHADCFGNRVDRFSLMAPHEELEARLTADLETVLENPFDYEALPAAAEERWIDRRLREEPRLHDYLLHRSAAVPEPAQLVGLDAPARDPGAPLVASLQACMAWARARFAYEPGATEVHAPLAEFVARGGGVCQDFAHLLVALARGWGVPARYVAGYVDPGPDGDGRAQTTHAWAEVLIPGAGWRGFDATHELVANDRYVPVAVGRDSRDAAPVRGTFKGDAQEQPPPRAAARRAPGSVRGSMRIRRESFFQLGLPYRERLSLERTVFEGGDGPRVAVVSGIHGDELEGLYVCHRLAARLEELERQRPGALRGAVELYPALNPLGLDTLQRRVPIYDVDLNRAFPGHESGLLPQRLAHAAVTALDGAALV
jgi:transglutaminase-like putative cysteine protease